MAVCTREEFLEWQKHPVTEQLMKQIKKDVSDMQDMLLHIGEEDLKELQGRAKAAINLINLTYEDLYGE